MEDTLDHEEDLAGLRAGMVAALREMCQPVGQLEPEHFEAEETAMDPDLVDPLDEEGDC